MLETIPNRTEYIPRSTRINAAYLMYQENTRRVYVGSSNTPGLRTKNHLWMLGRNEHPNSTFQALYNENPNFYWVYYTVDSRAEAYKLEQALIDYYIPTGLLINHALDAITPNKGIKRSKEHIEFIRAMHFGRKHTPEAREKIRKAGIGRTLSSESRLKMSVAKKGKPQPTHIADMCRERNRLRSKPVVIDGVTYSSTREAGRAMGIDMTTVKRRILSSNPKWVNWRYKP